MKRTRLFTGGALGLLMAVGLVAAPMAANADGGCRKDGVVVTLRDRDRCVRPDAVRYRRDRADWGRDRTDRR